jgi:hypothetical protein
MNRLISCSFAALSVLGLVGCGGGGGGAHAGPTISAQPSGQSVLTGGVATFSVTAAGSGLAYQWQLNGAAIANATSAAYVTPPATWQSNGASYTVVVTDATGSVVSSPAALTLKLSPDQQIYESFRLAPSVVDSLAWNLPYAGTPGSADYLQASAYSLSKSPLTNGPQVTSSAWTNLATTLGLRSPQIPTRFLVGGAILVGNTPNTTQVSYDGSNVRTDYLAVDGTTVVASYAFNGFKAVSLSGAQVPVELARWMDPLFSNASLLKAGWTWSSGSMCEVFTSTAVNDIYEAIDYASTQTTTGANIVPARTGTTLTAAMTGGIANAVDGVTYNLGNGSIMTLNGFPIYVASAVRPNRTTPMYLTFFGLNGNVYAANLIRAGTVIGGNPYRVAAPGTPTGYTTSYDQNYQVRLNAVAAGSLQAAFAY